MRATGGFRAGVIEICADAEVHLFTHKSQKLMHTSTNPSPTGDWDSKSGRGAGGGGETVIIHVIKRCGSLCWGGAVCMAMGERILYYNGMLIRDCVLFV